MSSGYQHPHPYAKGPERNPTVQKPHTNNTSFSRSRRRYGRQHSSGSMTSTSRDFSTNRNRGPDQTYPQSQLTRKPKSNHSEPRKDKYLAHKKRTTSSKNTDRPIRSFNPQDFDVQKNIDFIYPKHMKSFPDHNLTMEINYPDPYNFNSLTQRNGISETRQWPVQNYQQLTHTRKSMNPNDIYFEQMTQQYNSNKFNTENMLRREDCKEQQPLIHQTTDSQIPRSVLEEIIGLSAVDCISPTHHFPASQPVNPYLLPPRNDERSMLPGTPCFTQFQQNCLTALASMLLCPHTVVPILVGLFSRPGSPTDYIQQLGVYLKKSSPYYYDQNRIGFKWRSVILPLVMSVLLGYTLGLALGWQLGVAVVVTATVLYGIFFCFILFGLKVKRWTRSIALAETLSRYMRGCNLLFNILFYRPPKAPTIAKPVRLLPISLNLSSCSSSMDAIVQLTEKIWLSLEQKYGKTAVRLQWASEDIYGETAMSFRKFCCLPLWVWLLLNLISILTMGTLLAIRQNLLDGISEQSSSKDHKDSSSKPENEETVMCINILKQVSIVCGVLSGLSSLVLGIAMLPALMKLVRGRPLQHPKQRIFPADGESITDTTMDSCYGTGTKRFYPGACFDPAGGGPETLIPCFPYGPYYTNGPQFPFRSNQDLTSAATVAAAAAAAAVTAADRQWRIIESQKYERQNDGKQLNSKHLQSGSLEPGSNISSADESKPDQSSEDDSASESEDPNTGLDEDQLQTETVLFNSDELLLNKQGSKSKFSRNKRFMDKDKIAFKESQSTSKTRKIKLAEYKKSVQIIQQHVLEACLVLSILDNRIGDRQTRIIICINGILNLPGSSNSLSKLTTFMRLIDQVLMKTPSGGKSSEVPIILAPMETPERESVPTESNWSPNVITLLTATVPETWHPNSQSKFDLVGSLQSKNLTDMKSIDPSRVVSNSYMASPTNFKSWWSVHHMCHLPLYLEDEPPGFNISPTSSGPLFTSPTHSSSTIRHGHPTALGPNKPLPTNLPDMYLGNHELADLNEKRFRHLLTLTNFMGRLIKLDRLYAHQVLHMSNQKHLAYMYALQYFANEPNLNTIITWLCLIQHWPFHAAWLVLFIERNYSQTKKDNYPSNLLSGHNSRSEPEGLNRTPRDGTQKESHQTNSIQLGSNLSALHSRVLKRLGPAIEAARVKALSASMSTMQPGLDNYQATNFSSIINSTLQICELAQKDRDPNRLAEFLRSSPNQIDRPDLMHFVNETGNISVDQLIRVMKLSPFLNPQINKWIKEVLLPKLNVMENIEGGKQRRAVSSHSNRRSQPSTSGPIIRTSSSHIPTSSNDPLIAQPYLTSLRLQDMIPQKRLKQFTVDDVCQLVYRVVQLSNRQEIHSAQTTHHLITNEREQSSDDTETLINDVMPPAAINANSNRLRNLRASQSSLGKLYEDRIRQLNITGTVLSMCPLDELQKEVNLSLNDWKIFSTIVKYLKKMEAENVKRVGSSQPTKQFGHQNVKSNIQEQRLRSTMSKETLNDGQEIIDHDPKLINTVSDTSLTVKSAPLTKDIPLISKHYPQSRTPSTKSMNALGHSNIGAEDATTQTGRSSRSAHLKPQQQNIPQTYGTTVPDFRLSSDHQRKELDNVRASKTNYSGHAIPVLCTIHQTEDGDPLIHTKKPDYEFAQMTKSHAELRTMNPPYGAVTSDNKRRSQQRDSKKQNMGMEYSHEPKDLTKNDQIYRTQTLPNSFDNYRPVQFASGEIRPNVLYCERHRFVNPEEITPSTPVLNYGKIENLPNLSSNRTNSIQQHRIDINEQNLYKASTSHVNSHTHYDMTIPTHFINDELQKEQQQQQQQFYPAVELPKDSASTSLAGELGDEIADASMSSADREDLLKTEEHPCDCNYWYSREQETVINQPQPMDIERSSLETLSTSTQSQLDISSGVTSDQCSTDTNN